MDEYEKALKTQENIHCNPLECSTTYTNLDETFREMKTYSTAFHYLECGVKVHQEKLSSKYLELAASYESVEIIFGYTRIQFDEETY